MPNRDVKLLERSFLEWIAEEVMERRLRGVPEGQREAARRQAQEELGYLLCTAPAAGDPVADVMMRAEIAAVFRATYPGGQGR